MTVTLSPRLPFGSGTSKLAAKFDKGIGVANTARNWNTVLKLLELAKKVGQLVGRLHTPSVMKRWETAQ